MEAIMTFLSDKNQLLNLFYVLMGLVSIMTSFRFVTQKELKNRYYSFGFYFTFGVMLIIAGYVPGYVVGILLVLLSILSLAKKVNSQRLTGDNKASREQGLSRFGGMLLVPALSIAFFSALIAYFFPKLGALVGLGFANVIAFILVRFIIREKFVSQLKEGGSLLSEIGVVILLSPLLASLGAVFNKAGLGGIIAETIQSFMSQDNHFLGVFAYCVGMMVFTVLMGNAFAAFAVITAGIGIPFVFTQGADPAIAGILGMLSGYCGTLLTPMAANFNIMPAVVMETKSQYAVIKAQAVLAFVMLATCILLMYFWAF